jgi:hypothetical protein
MQTAVHGSLHSEHLRDQLGIQDLPRRAVAGDTAVGQQHHAIGKLQCDIQVVRNGYRQQLLR